MTAAEDAARRELGRAGEEAAAAFLTARGFRVLNRNYHTPFGELDLVALAPEGALVFAEVKAGAASDPRPRFTPRKVKRVYAAALYYLEHEREGEDLDWRFDFLAVFDRGGRMEVEHVAAVPLQDYLPADEEGL
jgi:putative endonuclease